MMACFTEIKYIGPLYLIQFASSLKLLIKIYDLHNQAQKQTAFQQHDKNSPITEVSIRDRRRAKLLRGFTSHQPARRSYNLRFYKTRCRKFISINSVTKHT